MGDTENQSTPMNASQVSLFSTSVMDELDLWNTTLKESDLDKMLEECLQQAENDEQEDKSMKTAVKRGRPSKNKPASPEELQPTPEEEITRLKQELAESNSRNEKRQKASQEQLKTLRRIAATERKQAEETIRVALANLKRKNPSGNDQEKEDMKAEILTLRAELTQLTQSTQNSKDEARKHLEDANQIIKAMQDQEKEQSEEIETMKLLIQQTRKENEYL